MDQPSYPWVVFGRITDSPQEAVELIVRGLPPAVRKHLKPQQGQP